MIKKIRCFIFFILIVFLSVSIYMRNFYSPKLILKTAVKEIEISNKNYILCKRARVTGFDWIIIRDENGNNVREYCNINGVDPYNQLDLSYEFIMSGNTFVFYIKDKRVYYSETMRTNVLEYDAVDWDISYPVKHGFLGWFNSKKYITEKDSISK